MNDKHFTLTGLAFEGVDFAVTTIEIEARYINYKYQIQGTGSIQRGVAFRDLPRLHISRALVNTRETRQVVTKHLTEDCEVVVVEAGTVIKYHPHLFDAASGESLTFSSESDNTMASEAVHQFTNEGGRIAPVFQSLMNGYYLSFLIPPLPGFRGGTWDLLR